MPPKKGKDKKGKKKKKENKGVVVEAGKLLKTILKAYEIQCDELDTSVCLPLKKYFRKMIEEDKLIHRFLLDPKDRRPVTHWEDEDLFDVFNKDIQDDGKSTKDRKKQEKLDKKIKEMEGRPLVRLLPLIEVLRAKRYIYIHYLHVWDIHLDHDDMLALAGMVAKGIYQLEKIELLDCFISAYSITRFADSMNLCRTLTELCLDYNEFGDEGCKGLAAGLMSNRFLLTLSLCYCELTQNSGLHLNKIVTMSPVRNLYLNGNHLEANGVILFMGELCNFAENDQRERIEEEARKVQEELDAEAAKKEARRPGAAYLQSSAGTTPEPAAVPVEEPTTGKKKGKKKGGKKKGKGKKGKKNKGPPPPPAVGPQLEKLHLSDNGIDHLGKSGNIAPLRCMQLFRTFIANSKDILEIDLFGNDIGDLGSRQILEGLLTRKENKLPSMGLSVGHRVNQDTFDTILKLAPGVKRKGRRGGKGKKKKKK